MNTREVVYREHNGTGEFTISLMAKFDKCEQENQVEKISFPVHSIQSIMWCVNAVGHVELMMDDGNETPFCFLSGNGRWDLSAMRSEIVNKTPCKVLVSTEGFDELDSYTIIITGKK